MMAAPIMMSLADFWKKNLTEVRTDYHRHIEENLGLRAGSIAGELSGNLYLFTGQPRDSTSCV